MTAMTAINHIISSVYHSTLSLITSSASAHTEAVRVLRSICGVDVELRSSVDDDPAAVQALIEASDVLLVDNVIPSWPLGQALLRSGRPCVWVTDAPARTVGLHAVARQIGAGGIEAQLRAMAYQARDRATAGHRRVVVGIIGG